MLKIAPINALKRLSFLTLMVCLATPAPAREGEAFFQSIEKDGIAPGSRLEVINCTDAANGGIKCSIRMINEDKDSQRPEEEPLTIW